MCLAFAVLCYIDVRAIDPNALTASNVLTLLHPLGPFSGFLLSNLRVFVHLSFLVGQPASMAQVPDPNLIPAVPSEAARSSARAFAGVGIALNVIAFLAFGGRLVTRSFPVFRLGADDYIIAIAYVSTS